MAKRVGGNQKQIWTAFLGKVAFSGRFKARFYVNQSQIFWVNTALSDSQRALGVWGVGLNH